jgi:hypothetical protein
MNMGPIGCPETSVRNFHYLLRNSPGERISAYLRSTGTVQTQQQQQY